MLNGIWLVKMNFSKLNIGIIFFGGPKWFGGLNYLKNLIAIVKKFKGEKTNVFLITFSQNSYELAIRHEICEEQNIITINSLFLRFKALALLSAFLPFTRNSFYTAIRENEIEVVFEAGIFLGFDSNVPILHWIPDFQHKVYPEYFSKFALLKREIITFFVLKFRRNILVSSESAKQDFVEHYSRYHGNVHVCPFAVQKPLDQELNIGTIDAAISKFIPDKKFIYLPNQFWKHKNHRLVIDALEILIESFPHVIIVCTGETIDYRNPSYFNELQHYLISKNLCKRFVILGHVDYSIVRYLMHLSLAIVNPSFFEGWSTSVEEAKSLNKDLILSDIAVHREQAPDAHFFDPNSAKSLADTLSSYLSQKETKCFRENESDIDYQKFQEKYANTFYEIVLRVGEKT